MPNLEELKQKQQQTWSAGDYSRIAWITVPLADVLIDGVDLKAGSKVLDVATGTGHVALAAARRFCDVTAIDYVPRLLEHGRARAAAEGLSIDFREGDAEKLAFADNSFDCVLSTVGAMFAPDQQKTANELLRVCRPGGVVGMINWRPEGFTAESFKLVSAYVPPPTDVTPPSAWGKEERVKELFGDRVSSLELRRGSSIQRFPSVAFYLDFFFENFGPTRRTAESLSPERRAAYRRDLEALVSRLALRPDGSVAIEAMFLLVRAVKKG